MTVQPPPRSKGTRPDTAVARRWPRRVAVATATVGAAAAATTAAGGWYYADELLRVDTSPVEYPVTVVELAGTDVVLTGTDADHPGLVGLDWGDGYARLGPRIRRDGQYIVRPLIPFPDVPQLGTRARASAHAYPSATEIFRKVSELDADDVTYRGPLGEYAATLLASSGRRWVVHVHGRGGTRAEAYRLLPRLHELGYPQLSISYRNDPDAPADPRGRYGLGWTEADDLAAAVDYARRHGADDVVLTGYSMGGAIVGTFLRVYGTSGIAGVVYDSPVLSWADVLAHESANRNLPRVAATVAAAAVRLRTGLDLRAMDQVRHAAELDVPVLLIHGSADPTVPVHTSDAFAQARPDLVTYVRPAGAGHVRAWNADPAAYEAAVGDFVAQLH